MVSSLWKAAAEGDLEKVRELVANADTADLEIKDHTGATPLIQAVSGGHLEVVKVLLAKGADPNNESSQGRPDTYTSDPEILKVLAATRALATPNGLVTAAPEGNEQNPPQNPDGTPAQFFYYPPPPPVGPDGNYMRFYEGADGPLSHGGPNMPPPDIARTIPCRYYPACRYGSSCMFAHPQTPYFAGLPPPPHYGPPYEQGSHPGHFSGPYYPVPFHPAGGPPPPPQIVIPGSSAVSPPQPPSGHHRSASDVLSPQSAPFSPASSLPAPLPYPSMTPVSPVSYSPSGLPPLPPHGPSPIHGPVPGQAPPQPPHSHSHPPVFPMVLPPPVPYPPMHAHQRGEPVGAYAQPGGPGAPPVPGPPFDRQRKISNTDTDQDVTNFRGDAGRRGGFGRRPPPGKKPPCMFFPSGKCRNGDDCRFPHVLPDQAGSFANGGSGPMQGRFNGRRAGSNEEPKTDFEVKYHDKQANGNVPTRPFYGPGGQRPFDKALKNGVTNGHLKPQRIPNADDFPSLTEKPSKSTLPQANGYQKAGLTAAQVLKEPAPPKKAFLTATSSEASRSGNQTPDTPPSPHDGDRPMSQTEKSVLVNGINSVPKTSNHSALPAASTVEVSA